MIWSKLKITAEQKHFQRDWLEKMKKQILDEPQSDFPLNVDNYITKRAGWSLQIRIVNSTSFMISKKGQTILVTMSAYLGRTPIYEKIAVRFFWYGIYNDVSDYIQKCDSCQRQHSLPPNVKNEMHSVPVSPHVTKQIDLELCSLPEMDGYRHLFVWIHSFTKW